MNFLAILKKRNQSLTILLGFALIGAIGILDFLTGYEFSFSLFYVMPIALVTWLIGRWPGIMASLVSAFVWFGADVASGHSYSFYLIPLWNTLIRLSFFVIITLLLAALRNAMEREKELGRTDSLTGAVNSRLFIELMQVEINRLQRYKNPFTLVYIDLDNFKAVNDQFGHHVGDQVLRSVVGYAKKHLRKIDVVARLGGDEFALLLPETGQESARDVLSQIQSGLLEEMRQNKWPITLSAGVLTCSAVPPKTDILMKMADELMYLVKRDHKNAVKYATYSG